GPELPLGAGARVLQRRRRMEDLSAPRDRHQELLLRGAVGDRLAPGRVQHVDQHARGRPLLEVIDEIARELAVDGKPADLEDAGNRDLVASVGELDTPLQDPPGGRTADNLNTPPSAASSAPVTSRVPTPQAPIFAPCCFRLAI